MKREHNIGASVRDTKAETTIAAVTVTPEIALKQKDDQNHESDRQQQRELDVDNRGPNGGRAVDGEMPGFGSDGHWQYSVVMPVSVS